MFTLQKLNVVKIVASEKEKLEFIAKGFKERAENVAEKEINQTEADVITAEGVKVEELAKENTAKLESLKGSK